MPRPHPLPAKETEFYCTAQWHLAQLSCSFSAILYPFALQLVDENGLFFASAETVAHHFGRDEDTFYRACKDLLSIGFFLREDRLNGDQKPHVETVIYRPISHKSWTLTHPGQCCEKIEMPWSSEGGDPLAKRLYTACGGRIKFYPNEIACLRASGLSDDEIVRCWAAYWETESKKSLAGRFKVNRKGIKGRFLHLMKEGAHTVLRVPGPVPAVWNRKDAVPRYRKDAVANR